MQIVKKFLLVLLVIFVSMPIVNAEDVKCEYPNRDTVLTYTNGYGKPTVNYQDWADKSWTRNWYIFKWGESLNAFEEMYIDPALYLRQGATCPTNFYICEYTDISIISLPGFFSLGADIDSIVGKVIGLFGAPTDDFVQTMNDWGWSLSGSKSSLYLLNYDSYENHEYKEYEGGKVSFTTWDKITEGWTNWNCAHIPVLRQICGAAGGIVYGGWDIIWGLINGSGDSTISIYYRNFQCKKATYQGEHTPMDVNCSAVENSLARYDDAITSYKNCSDEKCKAGKVKVVNDEEKRLKSVCKNVLANYTYNELQTACITSCVNLQSTLNEKKKGTDLYRDLSKSQNGNCNLSARLVNWIMKFINWMRYIVPVLLVLLSILDYIKAIASDSEDEVKKVTSRFVRRLIVTVIIFIVPLALDFLLGIFGINANNFCL